ncbi:MAG: hypothetical protein Fur0044_26230 [Anaerolineae bacterium]|nr:hypothetical protein [Anaerolineales bacterium]MCK6628062.1 hypothetical protein [Anaerolineae bacterium]MCQ3975609.1 hypothetical protein [Anaerolineae bacterium]
MAEEKYLAAEQWARIVATSWLEADFQDQLEKDPVAAVRKRFPEDQYPDFKFTKILFINDNPGYTKEELQDLLSGKKKIVPRSGIPFTHGRREEDSLP